MVTKPKQIGAVAAKAKFLSIISEVQRTGKTYVVTKHGKPVVKMSPVEQPTRPKAGSLKGTVLFEGDIISPIDVKWDAES